MFEERPFRLPRYGSIRVDIGAILDLLPGQSNGEFAALRIEVPQCEGRQENLPTGEPIAGIDHQPANQPADVVEQEVAHGAEVTITCNNGVTIDFGGIS